MGVSTMLTFKQQQRISAQLKAKGIQPVLNKSTEPEDLKPMKHVQVGLSDQEKTEIGDIVQNLELKLGITQGELAAKIDLKSILDEPMRCAVLNKKGEILSINDENGPCELNEMAPAVSTIIRAIAGAKLMGETDYTIDDYDSYEGPVEVEDEKKHFDMGYRAKWEKRQKKLRSKKSSVDK